jgi:hypothetical protein
MLTPSTPTRLFIWRILWSGTLEGFQDVKVEDGEKRIATGNPDSCTLLTVAPLYEKVPAAGRWIPSRAVTGLRCGTPPG